MAWRGIPEKIPAEKRWEITAKVLREVVMLYGATLMAAVDREKFHDSLEKAWGEIGKKFIPMVKEASDIPVEDAAAAGNLLRVAGSVNVGREFPLEIIEETRERTVCRVTKCPWLERLKEFGFPPDLVDCGRFDLAWCREGLKAINPKLEVMLTKALPRGDPYCEHIVELKE